MVKKKLLTALLLAGATIGAVVTGCATLAQIAEPPLRGNLRWNPDLPNADFPAAAETVDLVLNKNRTEPVGATITSLMALVNSEQPRIAIAADGRVDQFEKRGITVAALYTDPFDLFEKYKSYIKKAVIWDTECIDTVNLASTYAGLEGAVVVTWDDLEKLRSRGISPRVIADYRDKFRIDDPDPVSRRSKQRLAVYGYMYNHLYPRCTHRIITSLAPELTVNLRDYSMAVKSAIIFLEFDGEEGQLAEKFFARARAGNTAVLGWAPNGDEGGIVGAASRNGAYVWASDHSVSMTYFAAQRGETPKPTPTNADEYLDANGNVIPGVYVAIGISDGDNLQYMQWAMFDLFNNPAHKDPRLPPLSWTINPAAASALPAIYNYYIEEQVAKYPQDCFMTGPSGVGYFYSNRMYGSRMQNAMLNFYSQTSDAALKTGINSVSVWYAGVGDPPIPEGFMNLVAPLLPNVSSVTFQEKMESRTYGGVLFGGWNDPYNGPLQGNFQREIQGALDNFAAYPDKSVYVALQAVPWEGNFLENLIQVKTIAEGLSSGSRRGRDVIRFVTVDQLAQLQRIEKGLPRLNDGTSAGTAAAAPRARTIALNFGGGEGSQDSLFTAFPGDDSSTWTYDGSLNPGTLAFSSSRGGKIRFAGTEMTDGKAELDLTLTGGTESGNAGLLMQSSYYSGGNPDSVRGFYFGIGRNNGTGSLNFGNALVAPGRSFLQIGRMWNSWWYITAVQLSDDVVDYPISHHLSVAVNGSHFNVLVDGVEKYSFDDTTLSSGMVGFRTYNADGFIDNLSVSVDR